MKYAFIIVLALTAGCAPTPKNIDEFRSGTYATQELCSSNTPESTHQLLANKLAQCYEVENDGVLPVGNWYLPFHTKTYLESEVRPNGMSLLAMGYKAGASKGYQQLIEIFPGDQCTTTVRVYELSPAWEKHTSRIQAWLEGKEVKGCGLW